MLATRSLLACALLVACSDGTAPVTRVSQPLSVTAHQGELAVTNQGTEPVFTFVLGRERSALVDWWACADASRCPPISAGSTLRIEYPGQEIPAGEREAIVYWWYARVQPGLAPVADSVRWLVVPLP